MPGEFFEFFIRNGSTFLASFFPEESIVTYTLPVQLVAVFI